MTTTFSELGLNPILVRRLEGMGCRAPWPVQVRAIPPLLEGHDVIGLAQTGTGKTIAFIAPVAHRLLEDRLSAGPRGRVDPRRRLRALVICPTRELAQQVARDATDLLKGSVLRAAAVFGKAAISPQVEAIERGVDILVATPGRAIELLDAEALELQHIAHVIIDEADRMMDMGFLPQVRKLLAQVPESRRIAMFSATMPDAVEQLSRRFMNEPKRIEVGHHTTAADHVEQHVVMCEDRAKVPTVLAMLQRKDGSVKRKGVLIFCRTKRRVGWTGAALLRHRLSVGMIHGDRSQAQRQRALDRFMSKKLDVLVATDVAARGLHIPTVRTVINYDLPLAVEEYVHRIGRAGHGGGFGESFTLVSRPDEDRWNAISRVVGLRLKPETIEGVDLPPDPKPKKKDPEMRARHAEERVDRRTGKSKKTRILPRSPKARGASKRPIGKDEKPGTGVKRKKP